MSSIYISGASGFIGYNLAAILKPKHNLYGTIAPNENECLVETDKSKVQKLDCLFHVAANNDTREKDRDLMFSFNVEESKKLFYWAMSLGCRNFVFSSSTAVYGNQPAPYKEELPCKPLTVYGASKAAFEEWCQGFAAVYDVNVSCLRYCNVYGPFEGHKGSRMSMIGQIMRSASSEIPLFEDGWQLREWVHVLDIVQANLLAWDHGNGFGVFNVATGEPVSFRELLVLIGKVQKRNLVPRFIPLPFAEEYQSHVFCSIRRIKRLGYEVAYPLERGLKQYAARLY